MIMLLGFDEPLIVIFEVEKTDSFLGESIFKFSSTVTLSIGFWLISVGIMETIGVGVGLCLFLLDLLRTKKPPVTPKPKIAPRAMATKRSFIIYLLMISQIGTF